MYGDSARSLQQRLIRSDGGETEEITIAMEVLRLDLKRWTNQATKYASVLAELRDMMRRYGGEKVPTLVLIEYLDGEIRSGRADSLTLAQDFEFAASAISRTRNRRIASQLQMRQVVIAEMLGRQEQSGEMAAKLASDFPNTPGGGEAVRWLMENPVLASDVRLEWLEFLFERYPYLVQSVTDNYLAAELLDALGRPLEALEARQEAESLQNLGTLDLGRLNKPNSSNLYREAVLLEQAGQLQQAADRFRILLNLEPTGQHSVPALTGIARVYQQMGEVHTAIAYLDTLRRRDLLPSEMLPALRLEPWLWMELEEYGKALTSWHNLAQYETNPDSLFRCKVQAIVCQYRLGKLEEARIEAKDLYSDFKDRTDLDETKALFYLEKGYALDKIHSYPEARKQYETITGNHPTSAWADDAAYSIGWSLIQEGEKEAGTAQLERFIENYPESDLVPTARLTIGLTYYRAEKYSEAVSALRKAWEDENAGDVWLKTFEALIKLYRDAGFWDAAIRLSREYLERFPDAPDRLDHQMNIGWYFLQIGQWDDAVRAYKPLLPIADAEREAEVQFYIGEAYMNKAEYRTAILEYLKVKVLGRKTKLDWGVTALYKAGNCYESLGDKEGAARMYRKIIAETGEASNYGMTAKKRLDALELK
jgi:tetratricopeptide (TPR) repeat protein